MGETLGSSHGLWEGVSVSDGKGEVFVPEEDGETTNEVIPVIGAPEGGESVGKPTSLGHERGCNPFHPMQQTQLSQGCGMRSTVERPREDTPS